MSNLKSQISNQFDRLPPHSMETEQCLLASMMLMQGDDRKVCFAKARELVTREDFYSIDNQVIFDVLLATHDAGIPIDAVILREQLIKRQLLEEVGGTAYLGELLSKVPDGSHWEQYAKTVSEKSKLRGVIRIGNELLRTVWAPTQFPDPADDIIHHAQAELADLQRCGRIESSKSVGQIAAEFIKKRDDPDADPDRISTGLKELDEHIGGLELGLFYMIGGRPGSGKSQTVKQLLLNVARQNIPTGLITIEERGEKVARNLLSNESGVTNNKIAYRRYSDEEWKAVRIAAQCLAELPMWVEDATYGVAGVIAKMTIFAIEKKCKVVGIDYLQLIDPEDTDDNRAGQIRQISRSIKLAAKRLNIAAVCCVQLNRGNETGGIRKPELRDLRESGSIEQDGDVIILCHRDDYYKYKEDDFRPTYQLEAIIAKNKDNSPTVVPLYFDGDHQAVLDWDQKPPDPEDVP